jgi:hypothetical protein
MLDETQLTEMLEGEERRHAETAAERDRYRQALEEITRRLQRPHRRDDAGAVRAYHLARRALDKEQTP